jgi:hypothetical protein
MRGPIPSHARLRHTHTRTFSISTVELTLKITKTIGTKRGRDRYAADTPSASRTLTHCTVVLHGSTVSMALASRSREAPKVTRWEIELDDGWEECSPEYQAVIEDACADPDCDSVDLGRGRWRYKVEFQQGEWQHGAGPCTHPVHTPRNKHLLHTALGLQTVGNFSFIAVTSK